MTPLAPLYLLAAFAVAGPILFHLWRRTPRGRREFSTLMFLSPSPPRVTSRSRVEHWLLLLMRATVLCLLAMAFARPLWRTTTSGQEKPENEELIAVLVDNSASLRREGAWTDLQKRLKERLSQLPAAATVALFHFNEQWSADVDFAELKRLPAEERREVVKARLAELKPGWRGTNLGEALVRTASALQETQAEQAIPARLRIILASDLQAGSRLDALNGFEWPPDMRLELLVADASSTSNAGLQLVERNLDAGEDVLRVRVTNAANSRKEQFSLEWSGDASTAFPVYVPPGQSRTVIPPDRRGKPVTSLHLKGDDDDFDNTVHIAPAREESRLVIYCGSDSADDSNGPRFYLEGLFGAAQRYQIHVRGWREALAESKEEKPALVVLVEPDADAKDFVKEHLGRGGTVLIASGTASAASEALKQCGLTELDVTEATVKRDAMLGDIDFEHPLFAPFAESQFSDFTGIRFWKHRSLAGFTAETATGPHQGKVLARFDDKTPAFVEFKQERGRVWFLTGGWHPADSQLARSSKFPPLLFRILEQAAGDTVRAESLPVGSEIFWRLQGADPTTKGVVQTPTGAVSGVAINTPFSNTESPGLYTLEADGRTDVVAVNLAAAESQTAPLPLDQLEALGIRMGATESPEDLRRLRERERQLQIEELEHVQKLWRWGILIAIVLLLIETWVAGRRPTADV